MCADTFLLEFLNSSSIKLTLAVKRYRTIGRLYAPNLYLAFLLDDKLLAGRLFLKGQTLKQRFLFNYLFSVKPKDIYKSNKDGFKK